MRLRTILAVLASLAPIALATAPGALADGRVTRGASAPELSAQDGVNGIRPGDTLSSMRGKVVLLKFFFVGCPACQASMPHFQQMYDRYASRGAMVLGVDSRDSSWSIQSLLQSNGYTFPVLVDSSAANRFGVPEYPTNYVIGADGVVKAYVRWDEEFPADLIEQELSAAKPVVSPQQKNIEELGTVPAILEGVKAAAAQKEYGEVLRIVEPHLTAATDPQEVREAAKRIQAIAYQRYELRSERIRAVWGKTNYLGAYRAVQLLASDFRGTSKQAAADLWVKAFQATPQVQALHLKD